MIPFQTTPEQRLELGKIIDYALKNTDNVERLQIIFQAAAIAITDQGVFDTLKMYMDSDPLEVRDLIQDLEYAIKDYSVVASNKTERSKILLSDYTHCYMDF